MNGIFISNQDRNKCVEAHSVELSNVFQKAQESKMVDYIDPNYVRFLVNGETFAIFTTSIGMKVYNKFLEALNNMDAVFDLSKFDDENDK